jgi:hypothetical protein
LSSHHESAAQSAGSDHPYWFHPISWQAALSALWYLGENNINIDVMRRIEKELREKEFETLRSSRMPAWMSEAFRQYEAGRAHG